MASLENWEAEAGAVVLTSLTLADMRSLYGRCPEPSRSAVAQALWALIVAMVHSRRGPDDRPSDWTLRLLAQGEFKEPVH